MKILNNDDLYLISGGVSMITERMYQKMMEIGGGGGGG